MPNAIDNEQVEEYEGAERFLRGRFSDNADRFGGSFAVHLNNAAAVELAEFLYSVRAVESARLKLKDDRDIPDLTNSGI